MRGSFCRRNLSLRAEGMVCRAQQCDSHRFGRGGGAGEAGGFNTEVHRERRGPKEDRESLSPSPAPSHSRCAAKTGGCAGGSCGGLFLPKAAARHDSMGATAGVAAIKRGERRFCSRNTCEILAHALQNVRPPHSTPSMHLRLARLALPPRKFFSWLEPIQLLRGLLLNPHQLSRKIDSRSHMCRAAQPGSFCSHQGGIQCSTLKA